MGKGWTMTKQMSMGKCDKCGKPYMHDGAEYVCGYCPKQMSVNYPIKSEAVRKHYVRELDLCPECGSDLDTGWECVECDYDAEHLGYTEQEKANDKVVERLTDE